MYLIAKEDAWRPLFLVTLQPPYSTYPKIFFTKNPENPKIFGLFSALLDVFCSFLV